MNNNQYETIHTRQALDLTYDSANKRFVSMVIHTTNDNDINIGFDGIIGYSNAIVYSATMMNADGSTKNVAVKLSSMKDNLTNDKIAFLNANGDVFTKIYYSFRGLYLGKQYVVEIDGRNRTKKFYFGYDENDDTLELPMYVYVMDIIDKTLNDLIVYNCPAVISDNTACTLYAFLIDVIERLTVAGFYYLDIKPENIGVLLSQSSPRFVMIDVDSIISVDDYNNFGITTYTDGTFNSMSNLWQAQIFTALNTVLVSIDDVKSPMIQSYKPSFNSALFDGSYATSLVNIINNLTPFIPRKLPIQGTASYRAILIAGAFTKVYNSLKNDSINISSLNALIKYFTSKSIDSNHFSHGRILTIMFYTIFIVLLPYPVHIKVRLIQSLVGNILPSYEFVNRQNKDISPARDIIDYSEYILNNMCMDDRCGATEYLLETFKIPNQSSTLHYL